MKKSDRINMTRYSLRCNSTSCFRWTSSTIAGGFFQGALSYIVEGVLLTEQFSEAITAGTILEQPRLQAIIPIWSTSLFIVSIIINSGFFVLLKTNASYWKNTILLGMGVGFCVAFPMNISTAAWMPAPPELSYVLILYLWAGCIGTSIIAKIVQRPIT